MTKEKLLLGNWKMNGNLAANETLLKALLAHGEPATMTVGVCAPAVYLPQVQSLLVGSHIRWGSQDISAHESGAYTGELAGAMLNEFACDYALVGHSERREYHGETSTQVGEKAAAALAAGITPVVCIGETLAEREAGKTLDVVAEQLGAVIGVIGEDKLVETVIAYEPVWAIGTGVTASPEQAQEVHAFIRSKLGSAAASIKVLYGGSVKPGNAAELFAQADIDGGLVGGASLKAEDFIGIMENGS